MSSDEPSGSSQNSRVRSRSRGPQLQSEPVTDLPRRLASLGGVLLAGAAGLTISFHLSGSRVDEQGVLREPFALLPISALLVVAGGAALLGAAITGRRQG